jgi:SRSO17 transposase
VVKGGYDGCACHQSGGAAGVASVFGGLQVRFRRPEGREALERYTTGLLTELPNKNGDSIAQTVPGTSAQRLREFLTNMPWDEEDLNRQRVQKMVAEAARGEGVLVFDETGFPK